MFFLELNGCPIDKQLALERRLLKEDSRSFCLVNFGAPRAIVLGVSGQPEQLLDMVRVERDGVQVLRRFSGGGTVIIDEGTLFVTLIVSQQEADCALFPEPIMRWTSNLYKQSWQIPGFGLRENDYVIGERKCGGNAQYIQRARWLHHTSFIWDYRPENMEYLLLPPKRPAYRADRSHCDFLCCLKEHAPDRGVLIEKLKTELQKRFGLEGISVYP